MNVLINHLTERRRSSWPSAYIKNNSIENGLQHKLCVSLLRPNMRKCWDDTSNFWSNVRVTVWAHWAGKSHYIGFSSWGQLNGLDKTIAISTTPERSVERHARREPYSLYFLSSAPLTPGWFSVAQLEFEPHNERIALETLVTAVRRLSQIWSISMSRKFEGMHP